jgi:YCII-related domain.
MRLMAAAFLLFFFTKAHAQKAGYDSVLAKKLHADQYGMKKYVLVLLKTGPANITDKSKSDSLFTGHMKNILRLAAENKLILAGPLGKNDKTYEGIFVLNTDSIKEAAQMLETDPAVHAGALASELYLWYSTAAIQEIPSIHNKIAQTHF